MGDNHTLRDLDGLLLWFEKEGGWVDRSIMGLGDIPNQGRGVLALQHIPKDTTLFTLPRDLTLSTRTSSLPSLLGHAAWSQLKLDKGWVGLILCMMWEESRGSESKWSTYLGTLPETFDTPMFWTKEELQELKGTAIFDKVGREDAERDYCEVLIPATKTRPDLFDPSLFATHFSLENYHRMGSRILSRSFQVEKWNGDDKDNQEDTQERLHEEEDEDEVQTSANSSAMDIDIEPKEDESEGSEDEDMEDPADVAMVPMADMLNARNGCNNARLFHEPTELKMVAVKDIEAGDQIYNTYGDPPNSDLLRRYGHVDIISSQDDHDILNPSDVVEVTADLVVQAVYKTSSASITDDLQKRLKDRVDWWLEEGGDDVFVLEVMSLLPDDLLSFTKLLLLEEADWEKARDKGKPPKPKLDLACVTALLDMLNRRTGTYLTGLEEDERLLASVSYSSSPNMRNALVVRLGEKRLLQRSRTKLERSEKMFKEESSGKAKSKSSLNGKKRARSEEESSEKKKKR